jgi:RimJ/RimL family protein N-acetyltransferase
MFADATKPHLPTPFLAGARIYLRPLEKGDLPARRTWCNDAEIRALTSEVFPLSEAGAESDYESLLRDEMRAWFAITLRENDHLIGEAGLQHIFAPWRSAGLSITIGNKFYWGKGYGREVLLLLMNYAFGELSLHRLSVEVVETNERALRFFEKAGFIREGARRDGYFHNHRFSNFILLSILEGEFHAIYDK